ncbi:hypothetical protein OHC33_010494 [Knufia fluminis]|uniref:MARVEL domain-containing protein n=1 Tax=Knufia fluminis TaxID=191047 RepID=A0AAN8E9I3_9EURO|nr:hypothetical protein OHC33_010494 [Knufia fluminis]
MSIGGTVLRFGGLGLRILQFLCAGIALGIFSYFLSVLADRDLPIAKRWQAVEGITGAATLYTIFGVLLVLFLGGKAFFGYLAVLLDILFALAFIAVAYLTRHGASSCSGNVQTPIGNGPTNSNSPGYGDNGFGFGGGENSTYFPNLGLACRLNTAVFAVSIIAIFLFLVSAIWQVLMVKHHKKEKAYGPSPSNNYTKGSGKTPFWKRNRRAKNTGDAEAATMGATRPSHETGTTIGNNAYGSEPKYGEPGYGDTMAHNATTYGNGTRTGNF